MAEAPPSWCAATASVVDRTKSCKGPEFQDCPQNLSVVLEHLFEGSSNMTAKTVKSSSVLKSLIPFFPASTLTDLGGARVHSRKSVEDERRTGGVWEAVEGKTSLRAAEQPKKANFRCTQVKSQWHHGDLGAWEARTQGPGSKSEVHAERTSRLLWRRGLSS